jgi:hypothetical protein
MILLLSTLAPSRVAWKKATGRQESSRGMAGAWVGENSHFDGIFTESDVTNERTGWLVSPAQTGDFFERVRVSEVIRLGLTMLEGPLRQGQAFA